MFQVASGEQGASSGVSGSPRQEERGSGTVCNGGMQDTGPQESA